MSRICRYSFAIVIDAQLSPFTRRTRFSGPPAASAEAPAKNKANSGTLTGRLVKMDGGDVTSGGKTMLVSVQNTRTRWARGALRKVSRTADDKRVTFHCAFRKDQ